MNNPSGRPDQPMYTSSPSTNKNDGVPSDAEAKSPIKRKRKSPAVPWKKPKGMPKRPLSAYNIFFKAERERLLNERKKAIGGKLLGASQDQTDKSAEEGKGASLVGGFAGLAKTIAAKWNDLDPEARAPYEEHAAKEKARYDQEIAKWRAEQKDKAADKPRPPKMEVDDEQDASSDRALAGYQRMESDPFPAQWFQSEMQHGSQLQQQQSDNVPSYINALNDDSNRTTSSALSDGTAETRHPVQIPPRTASNSFEGQPFAFYNTNDGGQNRSRADSNERLLLLPVLQTSGDARLTQPSSMRHPVQSELANDIERIQSQVEELRRARAMIFDGSNAQMESTFHYSMPHSSTTGVRQTSPSSSPAGLPNQFMQQPSGLTYQTAYQGTSPQNYPLESRDNEWNANALGPHRLPFMTAPYGGGLLPNESRSNESKMPEESMQQRRQQDTVFETYLRSLSQNLDDEAIDFLTSTRFE